MTKFIWEISCSFKSRDWKNDIFSYRDKDGTELFIDKENLNWAEDWDSVEVINIWDNPDIPVFKVVKLLNDTKEEVKNIIEWKYRKTNKNFGFVDTIINWKKEWFFVKTSKNWWAKSWDKVKAELNEVWWKIEGTIKEILSSVKKQTWAIKNFIKARYKNRKDIVEIAVENWARLHFSKEYLKELDNIELDINSAEIARRVDHRNLFTIAMDWSDTKDRDDAISIKDLWNWKKILYVHIADISHYIKEDWEIDREALERWNSTYPADVVIPMIHEKLSNGICSLNPGVDRLTMTFEAMVDEHWNIDYENSKIYESVINSNYSITYKEAQEIIDWKNNIWDNLFFGWEINNELVDFIKLSKTLADKLNKNTKEKWELEFDFPETKVKLDEDWKTIWYSEYQKYETNDWVKAFMLVANDISSYFWPEDLYVYRSHPSPKEDSIFKLQNELAVLWVKFDISKDYSNKNIDNLLNYIKWNEKEDFLKKAILVSMQKATYTVNKEGHFWLWKKDYTHSTSPIRRYSDLIAHRILKELLNGTLTQEREEYYKKKLQKIADKCNAWEDQAEKIESEVNKFKACEYMEDKIGQKFKWYISWINEKWVFVTLENTINWQVENLSKIWFTFNQLCEGLYEASNDNWENYNVWDDLKLELIYVSKEKKKIEFKIIKKLD